MEGWKHESFVDSLVYHHEMNLSISSCGSTKGGIVDIFETEVMLAVVAVGTQPLLLDKHEDVIAF